MWTGLVYLLFGLWMTRLGEAIRLADGWNVTQVFWNFLSLLPVCLGKVLPSFHPQDLLVGAGSAFVLFAAVLIKMDSAKKYRHGVEHGSARWGTRKDILPFMDKDPFQNVILTKTEGIMMNNRPKNVAVARNKNVLIIGGSGSGKTRFWVKPNLLQMHSSYVVTDPNG